MSRTLSLAALSTLFLATAAKAYAGNAQNADGYRNAMGQPPAVATRLVASADGADAMQGDNCGVDGYPWLSADGQPIEG